VVCFCASNGDNRVYTICKLEVKNGNTHLMRRTSMRQLASAFKIPGCPDSNPICPETDVGRFGNSGLNILEDPVIANLDFALGKYFSLSENTRLQFRLIMVNALNHPTLPCRWRTLARQALWGPSIPWRAC
jgi:hypothetical protein